MKNFIILCRFWQWQNRKAYGKALIFQRRRGIIHHYPEAVAREENDSRNGVLAMYEKRSEERRVGKECRSRWSP